MKKLLFILLLSMGSISYSQIYIQQEIEIENNSGADLFITYPIYDYDCEPVYLGSKRVGPNTTVTITLSDSKSTNSLHVAIKNNCLGSSSADVVNDCYGPCFKTGSNFSTLVYQPICSIPAEVLDVEWTGCQYSTLEIN